nr:RtcB family protein [Pseudobutyrivibrio sp. NOR37]
MFEIKGSVNTAICYAKVVDNDAIEQIRRMCDYPMTEGSKIRIMPDVHPGKGCTIGTTMTVVEKAVPNVVGVDIGCGMYTVNLGKQDIDFATFDAVANYIPHGREVWKARKVKFDLTRLDCYRELKDVRRLEKSIGTLGGGNHFIEIDIASDGTKYLVIHSGSRNLGLQVANYYQQLAIDLHHGAEEYLKQREELINTYKSQGRRGEIRDTLKELVWNKTETDIPDDLCYLYGKYFDSYLHDVEICQEFARLNREIMAQILIEKNGLVQVNASIPFIIISILRK